MSREISQFGLKAWTLRIVAGVALLASPTLLYAQSDIAVPSRAEVAQEVTLVKVRDLDFGRVIVPRSGRIDMTAEDSPTCTPNNGIQPIDPCQSAQFEGQAATGFQVRISVPPGRRIDLPGPGLDLRLRRMDVGAGDGLTFLGRTNRNFDFLITDPAGEFDFFVAGRILFRNNQAPGVYTGTFTIEAEYE